MTNNEAPPQMNRNTAAVLAIVAFALAIFFGIMTSAAVELDRSWLVIGGRLVASVLLLISGLIWAGKARR